ncbi:MAG: aminoglycoside phosphotransferase family protein, partial [Syntrophales bacterium]|nr:aminoglycoside phosphotransferase family protein [Syntrophales bacterium]
MKYLGRLSKKDPFYDYLRYDILPQLGVKGTSPDFRVHEIRASNYVYLYEELKSRTCIVGKFFRGTADRTPETASHHMEREFNNLHYLRSIGFAGHPHYVARPLGCNADLNCVLVEEFCYGAPLDAFIIGAIREGARAALF